MLVLVIGAHGLAGCRLAAPRTPGEPGALTLTPGPADNTGSSVLYETRAVWSWAGTRAVSRDAIDELVAKVDAAHLNVILLLVYFNGTAYFEPSHRRFADGAERLPNGSAFSDPDHADALSYLLELRDERRDDGDPLNDFEVHAWFTVHLGGQAGEGVPPPDQNQPHMLNALFPEFRVKYGAYYTKHDERYIHPNISALEQPRFRQYMVELITGLAEDYAVDGIHLDHIRVGAICFNAEALDYPGTAFDYPGCQADYQAWTRTAYGREYTLWQDTDGASAIQDEGSGRVAAWQVQTVGLLVEAIHDAVKAARPDIIISVASVRNVPWETPVQGQAAWEWLDQGWIDAVFPTLYLDSTQDIVDRTQRLRAAVADESQRDRMFPGLAIYDFDDPAGHDWTDLIVERANTLLREESGAEALEPGARGLALFRAERLNPGMIAALARGPFRQRARPFWGEFPPEISAP
jgi:uncharacterized lipoprotein YddW (UPF0748 family)